jgi:hypothetical protein
MALVIQNLQLSIRGLGGLGLELLTPLLAPSHPRKSLHQIY